MIKVLVSEKALKFPSGFFSSGEWADNARQWFAEQDFLPSIERVPCGALNIDEEELGQTAYGSMRAVSSNSPGTLSKYVWPDYLYFARFDDEAQAVAFKLRFG